ncbi:MAG: heme-dependent oxidative N-demethylase subunit alpha family protein [Verrucomicrobiota bacterium]
MTLTELFPDDDYRFQMRFIRGSVTEFFSAGDGHAALMAERRHWLQTASRRYAALLPEGVPLLEEAIAMASCGQALSAAETALLRAKSSAWEQCLALGEIWEPDYLLLQIEEANHLRLLGGCVCFPSSWSLAEKMGRPLELIHGVVPGLNENLGQQINVFLARMKPGVAWQRSNWGLCRSPELNQHPERRLPRLDAAVRLEEVWLRVEDQALAALPRQRGVLFGIRIALHPLADIRNDAEAARRLSRALRTMPEAMAQYKNLAEARSTILNLLAGSVTAPHGLGKCGLINAIHNS